MLDVICCEKTEFKDIFSSNTFILNAECLSIV